MPRFTIDAELYLRTVISPVGYLDLISPTPYAVEDFSDDSYYGEETSVGATGTVRFVLAASGTDEAELRARDVVEEYITYRNDELEWEITDIEITGVEEIIEPMTLDRAIEMLATKLAEMDRAGVADEDLYQLFDFLLTFLRAQRGGLIATTQAAEPQPVGPVVSPGEVDA